MRLRTILVPTDFSPAAQTALQYAKVLAEQFHARLHLLNVTSVAYLYDAWGTETIAMQMVDLQAQLQQDARRQLSTIVPKSGPLARRVTATAVEGSTVESILEYIKTNRVDLVVMGTHGRGLMGHMLLGSVAERMVRHSPVPVLTVHGVPETRRRKAPRRRARKRQPRTSTT